MCALGLCSVYYNSVFFQSLLNQDENARGVIENNKKKENVQSKINYTRIVGFE